MKSDILKYIDEENLIQYIDIVNMSDRDKEIVKVYLSSHPTYKDLGEQYNISHERIRQILIKFARKTHHFYRKDHLEQ